MILPPESILLSGSNIHEFLGAYGKAISQLEPDVREQLAAVRRWYLDNLDLKGLYEQWNGRTVAQVLAEIPPHELQSLVRRPSVWEEVRKTALTASADAIKTLSCPKCGGSLLVRFDPASPQPDGTTAGLIIIRCLTCSSGCCADGLTEIPPGVGLSD
jgi:hypothetical protein